MLTPEQPSTLESGNSETVTWTLAGAADVFEVTLAPYTGVDFSKIGFLFCGQGQMSPGAMAEFVGTHPVFVARFKELDDLFKSRDLGAPSTYVSQTGKSAPAGLESLYSALCLYTLEVAMFEAALSTGVYPKLLSAHSYGEFAQITAAGVMSFKDMVAFLIDRHACLKAVQGQYAMFAVNHVDRIDFSKIPYAIHLANRNTRYQTSFVCEEKNFNDIRQRLKEQRIACVKINVDFPFHTPWMNSAQVLLKKTVEESSFDFREPKIPFVSSVTGRLVDRENFSPEMTKGLLVDQMTTPVNFPKQLEAAQARGVSNFFELSPTDVLISFVEQHFEAVEQPFKVNSFRRQFKTAAQSNKTYEKLKNSRFFTALDTALKSLTGYSIQHIQLEDRIREDLGIDSIKKAEIVFEIIDSLKQEQIVTPANLSDLSTFGDILQYFETSRLATEKFDNVKQPSEPLTFSGYVRNWRPADLPDYSSAALSSVCRVDLADMKERGPEELSRISADRLLVFECDKGFGDREDYVAAAQEWLLFFQAAEIAAKRWVFVHRGSMLALGLEAMLTSLAQEKRASFKSIHIADDRDLTERELHLESLDFFHCKSRWEGGRRFVRDFNRKPSPEKNSFSPKKILAFGGLGGVGYRELLSFDDGSLDVLCIYGRKPLSEDLKAKVESLASKARVVEYHVLNAANSDEIYALINAASAKHGEFDLAIHSVGFETSELLNVLSQETMRRVLQAKVTLASVLSAYAVEHKSLKVIFNSSIVSEFGSAGQCAYAMANTFMNAQAELLPNALSLMWPGCDAVGMAAESLNAKSMKLRGLTMLPIAVGQSIFQSAARGLQGSMFIADEASLKDYTSIGQFRGEFGKLMKPASRDYSMFVLPGLTQNQLPYLKDHLIKKACIFPASGSIALMLFRGYIERGELGTLENFLAHNFLVVSPDSSAVTLEKVAHTADGMSLQLKSHQLLASGEVTFSPSEKKAASHAFKSERIGKTDLDHNAAVYTGPDFELSKQSYIDGAGRLLLEIDLEKAPKYMDIPLLDKLHRLVELNFSTSFAKIMLEAGRVTLPKSIEKLMIFKEEFIGQRFFTLIENARKEGPLYRCDILTLNEKGRTAMALENARFIVVGESKTGKTKGYTLTSEERVFFS